MRRALWITRFDWDTQVDLTRLVGNAIRAGFTDLLMQARGAGDALYRSRVAPASPKIAGRLGGAAAWDPLEVVISQAQRAEGARVHAWLNVLSGWPATSAAACGGLTASPEGKPDHLLIRNADALLVDAAGRSMPCPNEWDYQWMSPRAPAVEADLRAVVAELCATYPISGVHLDRIRYPGGPWRDREFEGRTAEPVTRLVRAVREAMPGALDLTCALVPDYLAVDQRGTPGHLSEFGQDGWRWIRDGLVDQVMPMVYTPVQADADDDWRLLMAGHVDAVGAGRAWAPICAGLSAEQIEGQMCAALRLGAVGMAWYSAGLIERGGHWRRLAEWSALDTYGTRRGHW